jgi:hypothetical protein
MDSTSQNTDEDSLLRPAAEPAWQQRFAADVLVGGEPGWLNPDYTYYRLGPKHELGMSALARAIMHWCEPACSVEELFELAVAHFPERGATLEQDLWRCIAALQGRGLLSAVY